MAVGSEWGKTASKKDKPSEDIVKVSKVDFPTASSIPVLCKCRARRNA
jgi:hypothetical protein